MKHQKVIVSLFISNPEFIVNPASNDTTTEEQRQPINNETQQENSLNSRNTHSNIDLSNANCIAEPSSVLNVHERYAENSSISSNKLESEDVSEIGSLSGPATWSGPESWGASDNDSWFESKNGSINNSRCSENHSNRDDDESSETHENAVSKRRLLGDSEAENTLDSMNNAIGNEMEKADTSDAEASSENAVNADED